MGKGGLLKDRDDNEFMYSFQASHSDMDLNDEVIELTAGCAGLVLCP